MSVSIAASKTKKRKTTEESDSIPLAISGIDSSKKVSKIQNSKFTNSIIADSNIVSEIQITNPIRHQEEESDIQSDTIMTASVMGSRSLQGRIVKSRTSAGRNASKSKERNSLEVLDEDDPGYISPAQLQKEKRSFIQKKVKQLKKDKKYGFKLSELDQKVTKA